MNRIAFGSCHHQFEGNLFPQILKSSPSRLVLLGDNIYADKKVRFAFQAGGPKKIEEGYKILNAKSEWKNLLAGVGGWKHVLATYDDHDYGLNNADKTFEYRNESMKLFWDFTNTSANSPKRLQSGVYSSAQYQLDENFTYKIVLMDTRSNKDPKHTPNGDFLGEEQWSWLENELLQQPAPQLIILGSSMQVLPTDKLFEETWNEFPAARARLLELIARARQHSELVLISGDVHIGEFMQVTCSSPGGSSFPLWELTSSGLSHSVTKVLHPNSSQDYYVRSPIVTFLYSLYQVCHQLLSIIFGSLHNHYHHHPLFKTCLHSPAHIACRFSP